MQGRGGDPAGFPWWEVIKLFKLWGWLLVRVCSLMCWYEDQVMRMASCPCVCVYVLIWCPGYEDGFLSVYVLWCNDIRTRSWGWLLVRVSAFMCWYGVQAMRMASLSVYVLWCNDIRTRSWGWLLVRVSAFMCWYGVQAMRMASCPCMFFDVMISGPGHEDGFLSVCLRLCVDMVSRLWGWLLARISAFM